MLPSFTPSPQTTAPVEYVIDPTLRRITCRASGQISLQNAVDALDRLGAELRCGAVVDVLIHFEDSEAFSSIIRMGSLVCLVQSVARYFNKTHCAIAAPSFLASTLIDLKLQTVSLDVSAIRAFPFAADAVAWLDEKHQSVAR